MKLASLFFTSILLVLSGLVLAAVLVAATILTLPDVHTLEKCFTTSMYQVHLCPGSSTYVPLSQISPYMVHALIVAEDGSFYSHAGFDWHEMEESLDADLASGHIRRGGSTLTQQLAKNAFLDKEKSLWRKLKEAYLAHAIERHFGKNFILEKYLNVVEFGQDLYGVGPAANHYFHKPASELNPLEAAYLAFLLPNPKVYSKSFGRGQLTPFGRKMVAVILKRMSAYGKLSASAFEVAMNDLPNFPWSGVSRASFGEKPSIDLDAPADGLAPSEVKEDERALDELYREDEGRAEETN